MLSLRRVVVVTAAADELVAVLCDRLDLLSSPLDRVTIADLDLLLAITLSSPLLVLLLLLDDDDGGGTRLAAFRARRRIVRSSSVAGPDDDEAPPAYKDELGFSSSGLMRRVLFVLALVSTTDPKLCVDLEAPAAAESKCAALRPLRRGKLMFNCSNV